METFLTHVQILGDQPFLNMNTHINSSTFGNKYRHTDILRVFLACLRQMCFLRKKMLLARAGVDGHEIAQIFPYFHLVDLICSPLYRRLETT